MNEQINEFQPNLAVTRRYKSIALESTLAVQVYAVSTHSMTLTTASWEMLSAGLQQYMVPVNTGKLWKSPAQKYGQKNWV